MDGAQWFLWQPKRLDKPFDIYSTNHYMLPYPQGGQYYSEVDAPNDLLLSDMYGTGSFSTKCLKLDGKYMYAMSPQSFYIAADSIWTIDFRVSCKQGGILVSRAADSRNGYPNQGDFYINVYPQYIEISIYQTRTGSWNYRSWNLQQPISSGDTPDTHIAIVREIGFYPNLYINGVAHPDNDNNQTNVGSNFDLWNQTSEFMTFGGEIARDYNASNINLYTNNELRIDSLGFEGCLEEFRIVSAAVWTANFTPPTSQYSTTTASNTAFLMHFNGNLKEEVKSVYFATPPFLSTTRKATGGIGGLEIPQGTCVGLKLDEAPYVGDGFTLEIIAYCANSSKNGYDNLFFAGAPNSRAGYDIIKICKYPDSSISSTYYYPGTYMQIGQCAVQTSGKNCQGTHTYRISYDNINKKAYFYIDNTFIGSCYGNYTPKGYCYIGCNPQEANLSWNGAIMEVKMTPYCKYSTEANLSISSSTYETHFIGYRYDSRNNVIELTPGPTSTFAKNNSTNSYLDLYVKANNGAKYTYGIQLLSPNIIGTGYPMSKMKIRHPKNNNTYAVAATPTQLETGADKQHYWLYNSGGSSTYYANWYYNADIIYNNFSNESAIGSCSCCEEVRCDNLSAFNFAGAWTIDMYVYVTRSNYEIVNLFDRLKLYINGFELYNSSTRNWSSGGFDTLEELSNQWVYLGFRHVSGSNTIYYYCNGKAYPTVAVTEDGGWKATKAGLWTAPSTMQTRVSDEIILSGSSYVKIDFFRLRTSSTACTTVPTTKPTTTSSTVVALHFEDCI